MTERTVETRRWRASRRHLAAICLITAAGLVVYSNTFDVPFQFDDRHQIADNPLVRDLQRIASCDGYRQVPRRFVGYLSFALNYRLGGAEVWGYHAVNLTIHVLNAILVYWLAWLTLATPYFADPAWSSARAGEGNPAGAPATAQASRVTERIALFGALLFVVHPVQTQAVTYIVQRLTSLAALFYLLSLVLYVRGRLASGSRGRALNLCGALLSAVCAMRTKEIAFTLPLMIALYESFFLRAQWKKRLVWLAPLLLTLAIIPFGIAGSDRPLGEILSDLSERTRLQTDISRWAYLMTETRVLVTYLRLLLVPVHQNLDYDYPIYHSLFEAPVLASFLLLTTLGGLAGYLVYRSRTPASHARRSDDCVDRRLFRFIAFGIFWFFISLSVESSFIPIVDVIFEHRLYLPSVGALLAVTAGTYVAARRIVMGRG